MALILELIHSIRLKWIPIKKKKNTGRLAHRNYIIITKAYKRGAVAIIDVKDYLKEAEHQLNNKEAHKKLQHGKTRTHTRLVDDTIVCFKNNKLITENIAKGLQVQHLETPSFYIWPKIHKSGKPGCPVVSSKNCHTNTITE